MAVGVVRHGSLAFCYEHGLANIPSHTPVTEDTVFRIASVTKTFTAIAVMQLWEQGLVDLDTCANDYLRTYRLLPSRASFRPATVRHLLTHTAGIAEVLHPYDLFRRLFGETVQLGRPVPSLREYYGRGLRIQAEPGTHSPIPIMDSPHLAKSSKTSAASPWTITFASRSSNPSVWQTPT